MRFPDLRDKSPKQRLGMCYGIFRQHRGGEKAQTCAAQAAPAECPDGTQKDGAAAAPAPAAQSAVNQSLGGALVAPPSTPKRPKREKGILYKKCLAAIKARKRRALHHPRHGEAEPDPTTTQKVFDIRGQEARPKSKADPPARSCAVLVELPDELADKVRDVALKVRDADLAPAGREGQPHITVRYGLHASDIERVRQVATLFGPLHIYLSDLSSFPATQHPSLSREAPHGAAFLGNLAVGPETYPPSEPPQHDVLKIDVFSDDTHGLHLALKDACPYPEARDQFNPHVTVAYLQPGTAEKYTNLTEYPLRGREFVANEIVFVGPSGSRKVIPLSGGTEGMKQSSRTPEPASRIPAQVKEVCGHACSCHACQTEYATYTYRAGGGNLGLVYRNRREDIATDDEQMSASAILASSRRDRQGDIIECSGVVFDDHRWNPVVMWDHGKVQNVPIGMTETPEGEYTVRYYAEQDLITQTSYFAPTPFARQIYALIRGGFIRANSIAVKDLEVEPLPPDPEQGHFKKGKHIIRSALAEVTWTPLPANPDAVASLLGRGKIDAGGFAAEPLDPLIYKSFLPLLPRPAVWANGLTLKSRTRHMSRYTRRDSTGGGYEEDIGDGAPGEATTYKDADMPPGALALHDLHDAYGAAKAVVAGHQGRQEHPNVIKLLNRHLQDLEDACAHIRDTFANLYPDHPAPEDDGEMKDADVDADDGDVETKDDVHTGGGGGGQGPGMPERTTPERVGQAQAGEDLEWEQGHRVDQEVRKSKKGLRRRSEDSPNDGPELAAKRRGYRRKSYDEQQDEALLRTLQRKQETLLELVNDLTGSVE